MFLENVTRISRSKKRALFGIALEDSVKTLKVSLDDPKECILKCNQDRVPELVGFLSDNSILETTFNRKDMVTESSSTRWEPDVVGHDRGIH